MTTSRIRTPCIGVCSTVFGDTVCRGCRRFVHEVVDWNAYDEEQKGIVWKRLDRLTVLVVRNYIEVVDARALAAQLDYQNIRYQTQYSAEGWVPELLKAAGSRLLDYRAFGLVARPEALAMTPRQLYDHISTECHALAQAHYDRSFARPVNATSELVRRTASSSS